ncbi:hypothetical protein PCANC_23003 [Puccinia coronata f. sp. avenae]|uniref:Uncharacterized protein n=1 Tax=Puccinia coronata f. sp. avenae TaxID=200324 RepID=A0A2N5U5Y9_9BASI|nr:hypothetical protein PCANC_23003 [Puccinia coronata f. sp. avenae]PLW48869.1 hypothetical protein PCASD_02758 [Puccinia coronata f. sp. avenae]
MALDDQHHSHSRLTRFLSKFTLNSNHHHSKRKNSSLPNLTQKPILVEPYNQQNQTINNKRSISQCNYNNNQSNPVTPLLPLPTIIDNSNNPSTSSIQEEDDEGADPNASIRPITPSSKALSITTHDTTDSPNQPKQRTTTHQHHHHQHQHHSSRNRPASSNSDTCSEPLDDAKSTFGNSSFASTKPTTVISLENGPTNRIAQPHYHHSPTINHHHHHSLMAQPAAHNQYRHPIRAAILTHQAAQSTTSESSLNQSHQQQQQQQQQQQTFTPTLTLHSSPPLSPQNQLSLITVPRHSLPHPSQNPHPAALADNASIITLASSGFSPSLHQTQNFPSDEDASVRALAPSRRESIESLSSRWSNVKSHRTGGSIMTTGTGFYTGISTASTGDCHAAPCVEPTTTSLHEVAAAINSSTAIATAPLDVVLHPKHLSGEDFHHHQYLPPDLDPTPTIELHNPSPPPIPPSPPTEEKTQLAILPIHPSHPIEHAPVLD